MSSAKKYVPHYGLDEYQSWEGDWELWAGVPVSMSPSPFGPHSNILGKIATAFNVAVDNAQCDAKVLVELDWVISDDTVLRPDCVVVCGAIPEKHLTRTPAIVVEVLSDSTRDRDLDPKRAIYQDEKVPWYLILDPEPNQLTVLKLNSAGQYEQVARVDSLQITICDDCVLQVDTTRLFS